MKYNNDLKVISTSTPKVGASLTYLSVEPDKYPGPSLSSPAPVTKVINKTDIIDIGTPKTGVPEVYTPVPFKGYTMPSTSDALGASTQPAESIPTTRPKFEGTTEVLNDDIPVIPKRPPSDEHNHSANDVYEEKNRIWFTPDERYEIIRLRDLIANIELTQEDKRVVVFALPEQVYDGANSIHIRFPWKGIALGAHMVASVPGSTPTRVQIERCTKDEIQSGSWSNFLPQELIIENGERTNIEELGIIVNMDDYFRVNILEVDSDLRGLTVELVISVRKEE